MNWNDPESRAALMERVGIAEYNRQFEEHRVATTVAVVNGYRIRPVWSPRFGALFQIDGEGTAFATKEEAVTAASKLER